jgi:hypothetical protein
MKRRMTMRNKEVTMKMVKKTLLCAAMVIALATMGSAHALSIGYTVDVWGPTHYPSGHTIPGDAPWGPNGYPGDTVQLATYTGTFDLTPGSTSSHKIDTLLWTIDYTYNGTNGTAADDSPPLGDWPELQFNIAIARGISFAGGASGSLSQPGLLRTNWFNDYLSLGNGSVSSFVVQGYQVDVMPLGLLEVGGSNFKGSNPWVQPNRDVMAQFTVSSAPVPEPASMALLGMGIAGLVVTRIRKRRPV